MEFSRIIGARHRAIGVVAGITASVAMSAPAAQASVTSALSSCTAGTLSQAFSQWGDANEYELAPGGNFPAQGSGWTLTGGAKIVSVDVPFQLGGITSVGALYLPRGATAQSPSMCVDPSDPTYRFIGVSTAGLSGLSAQAVYRTPLGLQLPLTSAVVDLPEGWGPVAALQTGAAPVSVVSGGTAQMSLRFQSLGGIALVDDVFVDPHSHMG